MAEPRLDTRLRTSIAPEASGLSHLRVAREVVGNPQALHSPSPPQPPPAPTPHGQAAPGAPAGCAGSRCRPAAPRTAAAPAGRAGPQGARPPRGEGGREEGRRWAEAWTAARDRPSRPSARLTVTAPPCSSRTATSPSSTATSWVQATPLRPRSVLVTCTLRSERPGAVVSRRGCGAGSRQGGCAPEVPSTAVPGQHVAAAALEVQQAAVEGAVMGVSEGHAGSRPRQAAGAAAAGIQGGSLVLASARDTVRRAVPAEPRAEPLRTGALGLPDALRAGSGAASRSLRELQEPAPRPPPPAPRPAGAPARFLLPCPLHQAAVPRAHPPPPP